MIRSGTSLIAATTLVLTGGCAAIVKEAGPSLQTTYFENKVFDDSPTELFPNPAYTPATDDTARLQTALDSASTEDADGGIVILRAANKGGISKYRLGQVDVPANIRLEVDPEVVLVMSAIPNLPPPGAKNLTSNIDGRNRNMFTVGRTRNYGPDGKLNKRASGPLIENVEIRSTIPGKRFTVDVASEFPIEYYLRPNSPGAEPVRVPSRNDGQNEIFAAPFLFAHARNFALSDVEAIDNYTVLPVVLLYADTDFKSGSLRFVDPRKPKDRTKPLLDPNGTAIHHGDLMNRDGTKLRVDQPVVRNESWGRTPRKGTVQNIRVAKSHTGYGLLQVYGGEQIFMRDLHGTGGITVRLEPGSGTDNMNRAGPHLGRIADIEIENISNRNGFAALWFNPHGKFNENIKAKDIRAYDSGSAILIEKSSVCHDCRDLTRGYFRNVQLSGEVLLEKTLDDGPAEVGNINNFLLTTKQRGLLVDNDGNDARGFHTGKPDGKITMADVPNAPSGRRWFLAEPVAPILALNRISADNLGRIDGDGDGKPDSEKNQDGFYPVDLSGVTIIRRGALVRPEEILYRGDLVNISTERPALKQINE